MKNFAICYNKNIPESVKVKDNLMFCLNKKGFKVFEFDSTNLNQCCFEVDTDFVFTIGGDGTILKTARFFAKKQIPVFGINLGRLGFLSQASSENIDAAVDKILENSFVTEKRIMLKCGNHTALNDFVIKGRERGRTSRFSLSINNKYICDYLADGIIISTPTGSTAYGLSAGGPVIVPSLNAFVIVPICPHTLTARPIVIPDSETITVHTDSNQKFSVSADGQDFFEDENYIKIEKCDYYANLALLDNCSFYSILRDKLHWSTHPKFR